MVQIIYPPRPLGNMQPSELPRYEASGEWVAQRKFHGSRAVLHIGSDRQLLLASRHGKEFAKFKITKDLSQEILQSLCLENGKAYWLDGELLNKQIGATNELVLFDVLQAGRYLFGKPTQIERLEILKQICNNPKRLCRDKLAFRVSDNIWMAETFTNHFVERYNEAFDNPVLEGLVLRRSTAALDHFGSKEYVTPHLIRCRKS
jgi:ATP-dependent DNA ligase